MYGILLCVVSFAVVFVASRRSLVAGLSALMAIGYAYGIVRANVPQALSHFTFDAAVAALYLVHLPRLWRDGQPREVALMRSWMLLVIGWPLLLLLVPVQDPLIQVVGFRGSAYLIPFLVIGTALAADDLRRLALAFAVLNIGAFGVAAAEFVVGIEPFFPRNAVTELIYRSRDVAGFTAHRIPSTFSSAHAYGGTLVLSLPFLLGTWDDPGIVRRWRPLIVVALVAAGVGAFMSGARQPLVLLALLGLVTTLYGRMTLGRRVSWLLAGVAVAAIVSTSERLQRFRTLEDTDAVAERVQGSVNASFLTLAGKYPLGNGLGGGGTSVPYFLQDRIRDPVQMENEYARIMLEQGIAGLVIWGVFIAWMLFTGMRRPAREMRLGQRLSLAVGAASFATAMIGTGTLTSIPGTTMLLLCCGWLCGITTSRAAAPAHRPWRDVADPPRELEELRHA